MPERSRRPWRRIPSAASAIVLLALAVLVAEPTTVEAAAPTVVVEPAGPLPTSAVTITVRGVGFDPKANGGVGIYVVFGPRTDAPTYYTDAQRYLAARWVHPGAGDSPGQADLAADGSFVTTLDVQPRYTDGHGAAVDCTIAECVVVTMAAHGAPDRSADTFSTLAFSAEAPAPPATPASSLSSKALGPGVIVAIIAVVVIGVALAAILARRAGRRRA